VIARWTNRTLAHAFTTWFDNTNKQRRLENISRRVVARYLPRVLATAYQRYMLQKKQGSLAYSVIYSVL
jgi:hypothetical protein